MHESQGSLTRFTVALNSWVLRLAVWALSLPSSFDGICPKSEVFSMRKVLMFITVVVITVAMSAAVSADCGCGGGKLKPDPKPEILTKA